MSTLLGEARVRIRPDTSRFEADARRGIRRATAGLGAVAAKAVAASSAVLALSAGFANLSAVIGGMGAAIGSLGVLPGVIAGLAAGVATLKTGLSGVGDALKNMSDPEKFAEALKDLAPSARSFALAVKGIAPAWKETQQAVQQSLFSGLAGELRSLSETYLPTVTKGMKAVSDAANDAAKNITAAAQSAQAVDGVKAIFSGAAESVRNFNSGLLANALPGILQLSGASSELLGKMTAGLDDVGTRFSEWVDQVVSDGSFEEWTRNGVTALKEIGSSLASIGSIFGGVADAAQAAGGSTLTAFAEGLERVAAAVNGPAFQRGLTDFFSGMLSGFRALTDAAGPSFASMLSTLGSELGKLAESIGPHVGRAIGAVAGALESLLPVAGSVVSGLAPLVSLLAEGLGAAVEAAAPYLERAADAFDNFMRSIGGTGEGSPLGDFTADVGSAFESALTTVEEWASSAKTALKDTLPDIDVSAFLGDVKAGAIEAGGEVIDGLKTGIEDGNWKPLGIALGDALGVALKNISGLGKTLGTTIKDAAAKVDWPGVGLEVGKQSVGFILGFVTGLLNFDMQPIFTFLAENWFEVLMAALAVVAAPAKVIAKITKILDKIPIVGPMISWLLNGIRSVGRKIGGWVQKHIFKPFGKGFKAGGPTLGGKFAGALEHLRIAAVVWADDLVKWFKKLPDRLGVWIEKFAEKAGTKFRAFLKKAKGVFRTLGRVITDWIAPRIGPMLKEVGKFVGRFLGWLIGTGIPRAVTTLAKLGAKFVAWLGPRIPGMLKSVAKFVGSILTWIVKTGIPTLVKGLKDMGVAGVKALIKGLKESDLGKTGEQMIDGLGKGLTKLKDKVTSWAKTIKDKIVGAIKDLFDINSPSRVMETLGGHMVSGLLNGLAKGKGAIKAMVSSTFGDPIEFLKSSAGKLGGLIDIPGFAEKAISKVPDLLGSGVKWVSDLFGGGGGSTAGTQQWAPTVTAALRMVGQPLSLLDTTLRRMNQESGGNQRAINLWDSNARLGIPSKGLMQVIDPTFDAYKHPSLPDDVWNPLSNIVASMRYALSRYGSLSAAYNRPGGYDEGGIAPGIGLLPKYTIKPERVLSPSQTKAFEDWMRGEHKAQSSALVGGDLVLQTKGDDPREDLAEALFQLRRIKRGGI